LERSEGLQVVALPPTPAPPSPRSGEGVAEGDGWGVESRPLGPEVPVSFVQSNLGRSGGPHPIRRFAPPSLASWGRGPHGERGVLHRLREAFGERLWIGACLAHGADMRGALARRMSLARAVHAPLIATNEPLMHAPERRALADVLA